MSQMFPSQNQYLSISGGALTTLLEVGIPGTLSTTAKNGGIYVLDARLS